MMMDIEGLLEQNDNQLFATIGRTLAEKRVGVAPQSDDEYEEDGRLWLSRHREEVVKAVCGSRAVQVYLASEKAKNRVLIVASIADLISALIWGGGGFAVAVLLVREGLEDLCPKKA